APGDCAAREAPPVRLHARPEHGRSQVRKEPRESGCTGGCSADLQVCPFLRQPDMYYEYSSGIALRDQVAQQRGGLLAHGRRTAGAAAGADAEGEIDRSVALLVFRVEHRA